MKLGLKTKISVLIVASLFALVTFEIMLRLFSPKPENLAKLEQSTLFLHENKANAEFDYGSKGGEFYSRIKFNSYGFRDEEFNLSKNEAVFRIAILGDSQEEALQVALDDTWQKVMGRKLAEELGKQVETYNFGVSGYGTDQQWLVLREKVWQFKPDMVILAFSPNDVGDTYKNNLVRITDGKLEVATTKARSGGNFFGKLARETYIYHLIIEASATNTYSKRIVQYIRTKFLGFPKEERFFLSDAQLVEGPFEVIASQNNPPVEVIKTWEIVRELIADMKRQTDENNAILLITVNIPGAQVEPDDWERLIIQYKLDPENSSPQEINEVLGQIAKNADIYFYDPRLDAINWFGEKGSLYLKSDRHFNTNGNKFMGESVANFILENKLPVFN